MTDGHVDHVINKLQPKNSTHLTCYAARKKRKTDCLKTLSVGGRNIKCNHKTTFQAKISHSIPTTSIDENKTKDQRIIQLLKDSDNVSTILEINKQSLQKEESRRNHRRKHITALILLIFTVTVAIILSDLRLFFHSKLFFLMIFILFVKRVNSTLGMTSVRRPRILPLLAILCYPKGVTHRKRTESHSPYQLVDSLI